MKAKKKILWAQIREIQKHRWIESEKVGYDVGEDWAAIDWIRKHAKSFRENFKE